MEKPHARKRHCNAVFIAAINYNIVPYGTAGLGDKGNAASVCALYVVVKRENASEPKDTPEMPDR